MQAAASWRRKNWTNFTSSLPSLPCLLPSFWKRMGSTKQDHLVSCCGLMRSCLSCWPTSITCLLPTFMSCSTTSSSCSTSALDTPPDLIKPFYYHGCKFLGNRQVLVQKTLFGAFDILDAPNPLQKWDCPWLGQPMPLLGTDNANRRVGCNNYTKGSPHSSRLGGSIFSGRWEIRRCISSLILCFFFIRCNSVPAKSRMGNLIGFQTANLMQNMALEYSLRSLKHTIIPLFGKQTSPRNWHEILF